MSKSVFQNIPDAETLLGMRTDELAGFVLEHLHSLSFSSQKQHSHAGNLASQISGQYPPQYRERIGLRVREAIDWLRNKNLLFNTNEQNFFDFTEEGRELKTAAEFNSQFHENSGATEINPAEARINILKSFLTELNDIEASLHVDGYSKMGQRFDRWKRRCVTFIAENFSAEDAKKLSRYEMLDASPQIARVRQNHTRVVFNECQAFLEVLLDEVERYGEDYFGPRLGTTIESKGESPEWPVESLPGNATPAELLHSGRTDNIAANNQASTVHADELYDRVKRLYEDPRPLDENTARIIVESVDDALREYGNTNQAKKVELRSIREEAEKVLPARTIKDLRERAEGIALKGIHPKTKVMRSLFYGTTILIIVIIGLFALRRAVNVGPSPGPTPTPNASPESTPSPGHVLSITSPLDNEGVLAHQNRIGDGWVEVKGNIANVPPGEDVRVYVFSQSVQDSTSGWWYYRDAIPNEKGEWVVPHVWLGSQSNKVTVGKQYRIQAIVAKNNWLETLKYLEKPVPSLDIFHPVASAVVNITIKFTIRDSLTPFYIYRGKT